MVICPTMRDKREFSRLCGDRLAFLMHDYASIELEDIASACRNPGEIGDIVAEADVIVDKAMGRPLCAVVSTDDYPGSALASVVATRLGLPAPSPAANLLCQHKYLSRIAQAAIIPEAVPHFALIDAAGAPAFPEQLAPPFFVKPVKSFFSIGAECISQIADLAAMQARWLKAGRFFEPFRKLLETWTPFKLGTGLLLAEELLSGIQVTLEGYAYGTDVHVLGIVDSVMYPGTLAFERFEYPSSLPPSVQERMGDLARRLMRGIGYCDGMFNIEFMYDPSRDWIAAVEVNPRMASQFADLYEKVDGFNSYEVLLDLASGREPMLRRGEGPHRFAASCVLRTFEDAEVAAVPSSSSLAEVEALFPDCRVDILVRAGCRLSDEMQDDRSYRYATFNLGGADRRNVLAKLQECRRLAEVRLQPLRFTTAPQGKRTPVTARGGTEGDFR